MALPRFRLPIDGFLAVLVCAVALASLAPVRGVWAVRADVFTDVAIGVLFFLHGAKLSREAILQGIGAWKVHLCVFIGTFVMFPIIGLTARAATGPFLDPTIGAGILLLTLMPSTVQSSIAFTALARGNVPAAVCSASASNLLGIVITPILVGLFLSRQGGGLSAEAVTKIVCQLLLPFLAGHLCRPLLRPLLDRYKSLLTKVDRSVIILVVYTAFSAAVVEGLWRRYSPLDLAWTLAICAVMLTLVLTITTFAARRLGFSVEDEIVIVFCGSKKSLASGVPIAGALFPAAVVGPLILPLMLFHQIQLMACAVLAQRYARRAVPAPSQSVVAATPGRRA
ncbi:bile acid:sodium symporter family protein [Phenylobacterium sp.]|uniref:bile acid:sodium symporter family protein n=1 Tax=Phenylobacterium sp. TaxID=1871053 RepID=UPI00281135E5|nr:bile acid:sodium symporter family protein [Phenylobacterium sp.]